MHLLQATAPETALTITVTCGLAVEIERLRAALAENDRTVVGLGEASKQQRAEIERLRAQVDNCQANAHYQAWQQAQRENERLRAALLEIRAMVDCQAEDEGLWFISVTASEAYLQQELRSLHDRIERLPA